MYSLYIVWYLFLAGMGSGAYALSAIFGFAGRFSGQRHIQEYGRIADGGFLLGPLLVALGAVFLLFDLGSPEKAWLVIVNLHFAVLTVGTWALLLFCLVSGLLALDILHPLIDFPRWIALPLQIAAFLLALTVMSYTGVFLATMPSVPFHNSWLLVALFVCSSLSTGAATITLYGFLNQQHKAMNYSLRLIPKLDVLLIFVETLVLVAFALVMYLSDSSTAYSLRLLLAGSLAPLFWVGVVGCGLALPCLVALAEGATPRSTALAISALLVLVGGFALRFTLVAAGLHITQLQ